MFVKEIRRVSSRIMCVEICIKREFWFVTRVCTPSMDRSEEERDGFWEELIECIKACEHRERVLAI